MAENWERGKIERSQAHEARLVTTIAQMGIKSAVLYYCALAKSIDTGVCVDLRVGARSRLGASTPLEFWSRQSRRET